VFHRPEGYNRGDDNIVRVTIRHLRIRLDQFYSGEGASEPWALEIPKGKYSPILRTRNLKKPAMEPALAPVHAVQPSRHRWLWWLGAALLVSNVIFGIELMRRASTVIPKAPGLSQSLFSRPGLPVWVVLTDSNLQVFRRLFQKTVPLDEYLKRSYIQPSETPENLMELGAWKFIEGSRDTSISSTLVAVRLQRAGLPLTLRVRHPHDLSMRDFQQDNVILLGGPWVNPWGQLFEDRLNFRMMPPSSDAALSQIVNTNPAPGEPKIYSPHVEGAFTICYVRLAVLPNLSDASWAETGKVVLVGGTTNQAVEAGGDFLINSSAFEDLLTRFHVTSGQKLPPFELVLEVRSIDATPRAVRVIAQRVVPFGH
jgi:hypothetical protein